MFSNCFSLKNILFIIALISASSVEAQILNIEKARQTSDTTKDFKMKATAGVNLYNRTAAEDAPVKLLAWNFDINALYYPGQHAYMAISRADYLRNNGVNTLNFGFVHLRANFFRERKINYEAFTQYSYDSNRGLDPRMLAGGGIRHYVIRSEKVNLILGIGGFYEKERWVHPTTKEEVNARMLKSSNYLTFYYTLSEHTDFNMVMYYQVGKDRTIGEYRHRWNGTTNLNSRLTQRLGLTTSFEFAYEDKPIIPITKLVYALRTGLSYNF